MDSLNRSKATLKGSITKIENYLQDFDKEKRDVIELKVKLKKLTTLQNKLEEIRSEYYSQKDITKSDVTAIDEDLDQCDDRLEKLEVRFEVLINSYQNSNSCSLINKSDTNTNDVFNIKTKIPPLILPEFSGKYEEFSSFKSQFDDLITNNKQLTDSQKLYYLRSCLVHEAKNLASNFDSFDSLYNSLQNRFENERLIVDIHVQAILNFEKIQSENAREIRKLIDCVHKNLRALKVLKYEQNKLADVILINILVQKLDRESRKAFELTHKSKTVPTFEEFIQFLEQRESVLLSINRNVANPNKMYVNKNFPSSYKTKTLLINENKNKICPVCKDPIFHPLFRCNKFLQLNVNERLKLIKLHKYCEICLKQNHKKDSCLVQFKCFQCLQKHNKLICPYGGKPKVKDSFSTPPSNENLETATMKAADCISVNDSETKNKNKQVSTEINSFSLHSTVLNNYSDQNKKCVLLSTGNIYLQKIDGSQIKVRCLYDSASNINILSKHITDILGIKLEKIKTEVSGLNSTKQNLKGKLCTFISNESGSFNEPIEFLVCDKITSLTPSVNLDISAIKIPEFLELADPSFFEAKEIHALLNADIFCRILKDNVYKVNNELLFRETEFGWIAGGKLNEVKFSNDNSCFLLKDDNSIDDNLKRFFDLESLGIKDDPCFREEDQAMKIFEETVQYNNERYTVELPFRKHWKELSDNLPVAKQRFFNLWRRFQKDSELYSQYKEIMTDYINQKIIERAKNSNINDRPLYYLPHQAVRKEGRSTSSTRIVFDAASHQLNELSLNDCIWPGPNLNPNLLNVLINFRLNKVAIVSDIRQAFLQIGLADKHRDAVRFLWTDSDPRIDEKPNLQIYHFNRILFGVNASPFILTATVKHHIEKYRSEFPAAVHHLDSFMYVDDWITGQDTAEEALTISCLAKKIMEDAGMELRKWMSNDATVMEQWKKNGFDTRPINAKINLGASQTKVLGLSWDTKEDYLTVDTGSLLKFVSTNKNTKRFILQTVGKLFDPLGLITPFIIRAKCIIQDLWNEKVPWDDPLPQNIEKEFEKWCTELYFFEHLKIPRLALDFISQDDIVEIHSFSDASKRAYGAAVYLKLQNHNGSSVHLITSKSRVAPLSGVTLPRLELLGALVSARLSAKVKSIVNFKRSSIEYHWTDSQIVLFWIKGTKTRWKQFVANRVNEITSLTDPNSWYHCAGKNNPADLLSRGVSAESLLTNSMWWHGPEFLQTSKYPNNLQTNDTTIESLSENEREIVICEQKKISETENNENIVLFSDNSQSIIETLFEHSNNYYKIVNILSYIFRFIFNCKNKIRRVGPLTLEEVKCAEIALIKHAQKSLYVKKELPSGISNLFPFVDENEIVRVGGRLSNASVPYPQKHPPILPKGSKLSKIYFESLHRRLFHVGPLGLLNAVRLKFWPLSGRNLAREIVHKCVTCFKCKPILSTQIMGNLPSERVNESPPFSITGFDLCGPYLVKYKNQRKGILNKVYICICICFSTKAIHLELLSDLTSDAMIATLKRFTSRRGKCSKIYTDNATNFVGSNSNLKKFYKLINFPDEDLANYFTSENINWKFIPPKSPHFGGLWEAGVKSVKHHLKRTIGTYHFTYEEFETIIIQIEGILNSRPLTPISSDLDNFEALTPGHFLIGRPITALPEPFLLNVNENRLSRWQKTTKVVQVLWKKWKSDYLNTLQARSKWMVEKNNVVIGQMALLKEDSLPVNAWVLGRIIETYEGSDGKVRVVKLRTKSGDFKRAITKIAILPIET